MNILRRLLVGLGSLVTLGVVLFVVPVVLIVVGFNPARSGIDSWADLWVRLSIPDNGSLVAAGVTLLAWGAWAYLAIAIIVEIAAAARRIPAPHLRGFSLGQHAAKRLVAGVALMFFTAPLIASNASAAPNPAPTHSDAAVVTTKTTKTAKTAAADVTVVTVREGDSLSSLAREYLGDSGKWDRIFEASKGLKQPGGVRLTDPDVIDVGWTLHIPATKQATVTVAHQEQQLEEKPPAPTGEAATTDSAPADSVPTQAPAVPAPAPASASATPSVPEVMQAAPTEIETDPIPTWAISVGVGSVLAAGVVGLVTARRRIQLRSWRPGLRVPLPAEPVAATEQQLRATAAPLSIEAVDRALRMLSYDLTAAGTPLPVIRAARLTVDHFELYLAEPARLPEPWTGTADTTVWLLEVGAAALADVEGLDDIPAPYPSLVTLGHDDEQGIVFLDLEYAGSLAILGEVEPTREALAALAIEFAVSVWADDLTVTVVGAFAELEGSLQTGRIRYLPTVERLLADLDTRAAADRQAMTEAGVDSVAQARANRVAPDTWPPEILILAGELTTRQRNQLTGLLDEQPRIAVAAVTGAEAAPVGEWAVRLREDRTAILDPVGLAITPQMIPAPQYAQMLNLVETATYDELVPAGGAEDTPAVAVDLADEPEALPAVTPAEPPTVAFVALEPLAAPEAAQSPAQPDPGPETRAETPQDVEDEPEAAEALLSPQADGDDGVIAEVKTFPGPVPTIRVLGPVEIENAEGPVEPSKRARLLEYATYLLLNPAVAPADVDDAIWPARPRQDNTNTRNTFTSKLRRWLGEDASGDLYLPRNRYQLAGVGSDWAEWRRLLSTSPKRAATSDLATALKLVRGRPFSGVHPSRYAWAEPIRQEMIGEIVEVSYELARRRLLAGDWRGVETAIVIALSIEPALEHLWRLRILAAHHAGDTEAFEEARARLLALIDELGLDLEPETEQLLADLADNPQAAWEKAIAQ